MVIRILELLAMIIPLAGIFAMIRNRQQSESSVRLTLASVGCFVMNSGAFLRTLADTEAVAEMTLKFQCVGDALFYYFFISFLISYLRLHASKILLYAWGVFECAVVGIQWSDTLREFFLGHHYFIRHETLHIFTVQGEQSALFSARSSALIVLLTCGLIYTVVLMFLNKLRSERMNLAKLAGGQFIIIVALVLQFVQAIQIELTPLLTSLSLLSIVISMLTDGFFGVTDSGHEWVFNQMVNPYIITDHQYGYLDANSHAKKLFPELQKLRLNQRIPDRLYTIFTATTTYFELNGGAYERRLTEIRHKGKTVGFGLLLDDETEQQKYVKLLNEYNTRLQNEVEEKTEHIRKVQNSIITGMASVIESRDNSTGGHINRTSQVVRIFARKLLAHSDLPQSLGLSKAFLHDVTKAAPMHDIGKIAVDDVILRKPGKFTDAEYEQMKQHAAMGAVILKKVLHEVDNEAFVRIAVNIAHFHHERWDGTGYPEQRSGEAIPTEARIMALADVFDALVSERCYKEAYSYDRAFTIIADALGTQFDPVLGGVFLECRQELESFYTNLAESA
ncbi:MAG TPA: hypothetical protein DCG49_11950 [Ruminococcus sp.]|nr:hypothetical protein [Ruminococcus sp.]